MGLVHADPHRLTSAVMNLAQNAVRHTRGDEAIALGSSLDDGTVRIWVRDEGQGIAVDDQERIFERFAAGAQAVPGPRRGPRAGDREGDRRGPRRARRARVHAGQGFEVHDRDSQRRNAARGGGEDVARILIAEDEPRLAAFLEKGLRSSGFTTTVVGTARARRAAADDSEFDLMVLDLGLPGQGRARGPARSACRRQPACR